MTIRSVDPSHPRALPSGPDLTRTQNAWGAGGPQPAAPKPSAAPPRPNVLNANAHPLGRESDTPTAAMLRNGSGQLAAVWAGGTPGCGRGQAPGPSAKVAGAAPSEGPSAAAPRASDDAALAKVPREQMKKEVEDAEAAVKNAKTPEQKAAAEARLVATRARADAWARAVIAQKARTYAGAGFSKGKDAARYEEVLVGPGDDGETRRAMHGQSTCALFARGVWRHAGVADSRLENKYVPRHAVSDVVDIARSRGAWVNVEHGAKGTLPRKGDVILIDDSPHKINPKTGKPQGREHVIVVVGEPRRDPTDPNKYLVDTVEGGQGKGGVDSRAFGAPENGGTNNPRAIRVDRKDGTLWMGSRKVVGWADGGKVASPTAPHTAPPESKSKATASAKAS